MNAADLIAALDLPDTALVGQRVPKKLLSEHAPTAVDRRRITEGIDEVKWVAALKPSTVGVPSYRDDVREYLEIAVLSVTLRPTTKADRVAELIHRAIPYPVVLISVQGERLSLSLAQKRRSQSDAGATLLDGDVELAVMATWEAGAIVQAFRAALALTRQPRENLFALYQGWVDVVVTLLAARVTGAFRVAESPGHTVARQKALRECARLDAKIVRLRATALKERQVPRQVELNLELTRMKRQLAAALEML